MMTTREAAAPAETIWLDLADAPTIDGLRS